MVQSNAQTKLQNRYYRIQIAASLVNVAISIYLIVQHTRLKLGIQDSGSFCSLGRFADCDVVNASQYSEFLGIPLASIGAVLYFFLFVLGFLARPDDKAYRFMQRIILWFSVTALFINIVILESIQLFIIKSICIFCSLTYAISILHFIAIVVGHPSSDSFWKKTLNILCTKEKYPNAAISKVRSGYALLSFLLFVSLVALIPTYFRSQSAVYANVDEQLKKFFSEWKDKPSRKMEVEEHNGSFGNPNARVQIVEFSDFECPYCRKAAFILHTFLASMKDRVYFVFKHFPLNATCNPALQYQMHPHACDLAKIAVCAKMKNKFWEVHDRIFLKMTDEDLTKSWPDVEKQFYSVLSAQEIRTCLSDSKVQRAISEDVQLGLSKGLTGTPTLYINGKQVTAPLSIETLRQLIEFEEKLSNH